MDNSSATAAAAAGGGMVGIIYMAVTVLMLISVWKVFTKAGQPGWAVLIPIYNVIVMLQIAGKPIWWIALFFIPVANIVVGILTIAGLAQNFEKGAGYTVGLILLPIIFYPMLAFGSAQYVSAQAVAVADAPEPTEA